MPGDSKTANNLMSWGSNVASSHRLGAHEAHDAQWKRAEKMKGSAKWGGKVPSGFQTARVETDLQEQCANAAQRLVDETNELQYCEQILKDNEREFENRERELMQALAEIRQKSDQTTARPVAEEVRIREEALWHLETTLRRLEGEEDVQGQAIVALVECVSCCNMANDRVQHLISDTAHFTKVKLLALIQHLREICVSFSTQATSNHVTFADEACEIDVSEQIARSTSSAPLRAVLNEAFQRLSRRCEDMRNVAAQRVDALLDSSAVTREECEVQSITVHHAHNAIDDLRERSEDLLKEIETCQKSESLLRAEVSGRTQRAIALNAQKSTQLEHHHSKQKALSALLSEIEGIEDEEVKIKHKLSEQHVLRDSHFAAKQRLEADCSQLQITLHTKVAASASGDIIREITRKINAVEQELSEIGAKIRKINEKENDCSISVQEAHSKLLTIQSSILDCGSRQKSLNDEASLLHNLLAESRRLADLARENLIKARAGIEEAAGVTRRAQSGVDTDAQREAFLTETIDSLKQQLLQRQQAPPDVKPRNRDQVPFSQFQLPSDSKLASLPVDTLLHPPLVVSSLENAVSTAPLTQLLLADSKGPVRVPLEPRYRRQSDVARDRLLNAFQL